MAVNTHCLMEGVSGEGVTLFSAGLFVVTMHFAMFSAKYHVNYQDRLMYGQHIGNEGINV